MVGLRRVSADDHAADVALRVPAIRRSSRDYWNPEVSLGFAPDGGHFLLVARPAWWGDPASRVDWHDVPAERALTDFLNLATIEDGAFPEAVLKYARRWGPLGICSRGNPGSAAHGHGDPPYAPDERYPSWGFWEPLTAWQFWSRAGLATLRAARALQAGETASDEEWGLIRAARQAADRCLDGLYDKYWVATGDTQRAQDPVDDLRAAVVTSAEAWMMYGGVRIEAEWAPDDSGVVPQVAWEGLPGLLAIDLMVSLADRVRLCAGCDLPVVLNENRRRPSDKTDHNTWCDREFCGNKEKWRRYQRERYRHKKQARVDSQVDSQPGGRDGAKRGRNGRPPGG